MCYFDLTFCSFLFLKLNGLKQEGVVTIKKISLLSRKGKQREEGDNVYKCLVNIFKFAFSQLSYVTLSKPLSTRSSRGHH